MCLSPEPKADIERCGRVFNSLATYSGGLGLKSRPGDQLSRKRFFMVFLSPPCKCCDNTLQLGHDSFLPYYFQFITHLSPFQLTLYSLITEEASLNKLQIIHRIVLRQASRIHLYVVYISYCDNVSNSDREC
jgi:hypothetical protein